MSRPSRPCATIKTCRVGGWDRTGNRVDSNLTGFHARVFQHEIDHLEGVFFLDRVKRKESIAELAEWEKYWKDKNLSHTLTFL